MEPNGDREGRMTYRHFIRTLMGGHRLPTLVADEFAIEIIKTVMERPPEELEGLQGADLLPMYKNSPWCEPALDSDLLLQIEKTLDHAIRRLRFLSLASV